MQDFLRKMLVDPYSKKVLQESERALTGSNVYPIQDGIPRFVEHTDDGQAQTADSFGFKWHQRHTYSDPAFRRKCRDWVLERYGFQDTQTMQDHLSSHGPVLDAGCGSGFTASLWLNDQWTNGQYVGADISSAIDVAADTIGKIPGTAFVQADLNHLPFRKESFGTIISEGVMHHTPSTKNSFDSLHPLLKSGGEFMFYVYRKKAPIREFTDDFIRDAISPLDPEKAWEELKPLTMLAQALSESGATVDVPQDVPVLGIKKGQHSIQRMLYWTVAKMYWNPDVDFETNHHVNFDWYHPRYSFRHTKEEVQSWCDEANLTVERFHESDAGWTVRARKL